MEQMMNQELEMKPSEILGSIEIKGEKKLAFFTGQESKVFIQTDFVTLKQNGGFIQGPDGEIKDWKLEGTTEKNGKLVFYGPYLEVESLTSEYTPSIEEFSKLRDFLCYLSEFSEFTFSPFHFFRVKGGGFLQLPPLLAEELIKASFGQHNPVLRSYSHPDLKGASDICYTLGIIQFRILTGAYPWLEEEAEPLNHEIRERKLPWLPSFFKGEEALFLIQRSMKQAPGKATLEEWKAFSPLEEQKPEPRWDEAMEKSYLSFERKRNLMRHRTRYILSGIAMALLLLVITKGIISFLSPPFTEGMEKIEVASLFYESLTQMDSDTTGKLTLSRKNIDPQKQFDFIFVTNRVRRATEGNIVDFTPQLWMEKSGKPLAENEMIYGVSDLELTLKEDGSMEADYLLWGMPVGENSDRMPVVEKTHDLIQFEQKKGGWFILSISTEESEPTAIPE